MAEMTGERPDRGQMILVAGIVLAVILVALVLLVNTAIYTDNVATRDSDAAGEAIEYRGDAVDAVGGLLEAENAAGANRTTIKDNLTSGIGQIDATLAGTSAGRSAAAELSADRGDMTDGWRIRTNESVDSERWEANATGVRGFVIDVDPGAMAAGESFEVVLGDTELVVNRTEDGLTVEDGGVVCETGEESGTVRFDVTGERFAGEPCTFGWPAFDAGSTVGLSNASSDALEYELTIESGDSPPSAVNASEAVYAVEDVALRYDTPELRYEATVRVAPGEHDA